MAMASLQQRIGTELHVRSLIDVEQEIVFRRDFIAGYLQKTHRDGLVLGISGGQDSALAGRLCQMAVERLRQETGHPHLFIALRLPYGAQHDEEDAQRAIRFIQPDRVYSIDIQPAVDAAASAYLQGTGLELSDYNKGNQKAQERMTVHYRVALHFNALVVGTDHAAEAVTGFFTKFGDGGADLTPLTGLTKQQGRELLKKLGADPLIYAKAPTADLLSEKPGQLDEDELGLSYQEIDAYLEGREVAEAVSARLEGRYLSTEHKRRLPVTPFDKWWMDSEDVP